MNVLIYDKSHDLRRFYSSLIKAISPNSQIRKTDNNEEFLFWTNEQKHDLVIIDIDFIGNHLVETVTNAQSKNPDVIIVALTHFPQSMIRNKLAAHGVVNYFERTTQLQEFIEVIKSMQTNIGQQNNNYVLQDIQPASGLKFA